MLETVRHHSYEHVNEDNDGHDVVGHEESLADSLNKLMLLLEIRTLRRTDAKEGPKERCKCHVQPRKTQERSHRKRALQDPKKKRKTQQHAFSFSQKMGYDEPKMGRNSHRKKKENIPKGRLSQRLLVFKDRSCKRENALI